MRQFSALLSMAIFGWCAGGARGEDPAQPLDDNFLIKAAAADNAEIQTSKLADSRASTQQIKDFAAQVVKDHEKSADRLAKVIKNRKVAIVSGLEKENRDQIDRLSKVRGDQFDREYLHWMVMTHTNAISMFENEAKNGKDAEIRSFADETLPTLREHLKRAEELAKTLK
jgi:putative membrane protein